MELSVFVETLVRLKVLGTSQLLGREVAGQQRVCKNVQVLQALQYRQYCSFPETQVKYLIPFDKFLTHAG